VLTVISTPWFRLPALAILVVTVQTVIISQLHLLGASPDLVILCAVAGGLVGGPQRGTVAGFVFGVAYDLSLTTPFGLWALVLCVAGFSVGLTRNEAIRDNRWLQTAIVFLGSGATVVAYAGVATVFGSEGIFTLRLVPTALVIAVVNAVLTQPAVKVLRFTVLPGDRRPV
jgi:rod shape-determining protein MreD